MAVSVSITNRDVWGSHQIREATVTFDASYPTGGETVAASDFELQEIKAVLPLSPSIDDEAVTSTLWDAANSKVLVIQQNGVQEGNATDLSSTTVQCLVIGK